MLAYAIVPLMMLNSLPHQVMQDVEYARELCRSLQQYFIYDEGHSEVLDFNGDGLNDYVIDTRGFKCGMLTNQLFGGDKGKPLYVYISDGPNNWKKGFSAYVFEYLVAREYGELPYLDVWIRGEVGYKTNYMRQQWSGERFEVIEQELGVDVPDQLWKQFD